MDKKTLDKTLESGKMFKMARRGKIKFNQKKDKGESGAVKPFPGFDTPSRGSAFFLFS